MNRSIWLSLALVAGFALSVSVGAVTPSPDADTAAHNAAVSKVRAQLADARAAAKRSALRARSARSSNGVQPKAMGPYVYPGTPMANPYRAYPPSCAAYPLPDKASGPSSGIFAARIPLYARDPNGNARPPETVTVTIWRLACSSSGSITPYNTDGGFNAMTLMRIDRDPANDNRTDVFPTFPLLQVKQGNVGYSDDASVARAASEPNTVVSDGIFDAPIYSSTTYVLENFDYGADYNHLYSYAFNFLITPFATGVSPVEFSIPDYSPTSSTYPDAYAPLFLDGYAAAQWINTPLNEGLIVQVAEGYDPGNPTRRQLSFDLLLQDLNGDPLWLVGNAAFEIGTTNLTIETKYLGVGLTQIPWGIVTVQVQNCNDLDMTFSPNAGLPAPIPTFSGLTTYTRLFSPNGMVCE